MRRAHICPHSLPSKVSSQAQVREHNRKQHMEIYWTLCIEAVKIAWEVRIPPASAFLEIYAVLPGNSYEISNSL